MAPIFPVGDVEASLAFYERLGFEARLYEGGGYGYVTLDGVEFHVGLVPDGAASNSSPAAAYLWVDDSDELALAWRAAGADVRLPEDTEWGLHEGVLIDPDGNIIRFGSPIRPSMDGPP